MTREVFFVLFPDFQILDAAGPVAAFELANLIGPDQYRLRFGSRQAGPCSSSAGVPWPTTGLRLGPRTHTLIVVGGNGTRQAIDDSVLLRWLRTRATRVPRLASVCTGSFLLARAGLLDGKRATTHWSRARELALHFPKVLVDPDRIWVQDGQVWTSAGISAGIDLALALIAADQGTAVANRVARHLVVFAQRPGGQTQYSSVLELGSHSSTFDDLHLWIRGHLRARLDVGTLARRARMSPRSFARTYALLTGVTPAKAVERLRLEAAQAELRSGNSVKGTAEAVGFANPERMRRAFLRHYGVSPREVGRSSRPKENGARDAGAGRRAGTTSGGGVTWRSAQDHCRPPRGLHTMR